MFSQTVEYALRAFLCIARRSPQTVRLRDVASEVDAPPRYLAKLLAELARAGYLLSTRGPNGGYRLAPREVTASLSEIAAVFDAVTQRRCLLGHGVCGSTPGCAVHERWAPIARAMNQFLDGTRVSDLVPADAPISPSTST